MTRKRRTIEEIERAADISEAQLARRHSNAPTREKRTLAVNLDALERFDHIFSPEQVLSVKGCLARIATRHGLRARKLIAASWGSILTAAHQYEASQVWGPKKKQRIGRVIKELVKRHGEESLAVGIVRGDDFRIRRYGPDSLDVQVVRRGKTPRGRPRSERDAYIAAVCRVYEKLTGRPSTLTWDFGAEGYRGPLIELLRASLAPEIFHNTKMTRMEEGHPLRDSGIASAVKRVRRP